MLANDCTEKNDQQPSNENKKIIHINKINQPNIDSICNNKLNTLLEQEKQKLKSEVWSKIDKTNKIQILHGFAEKYGVDNSLPIKEIKSLKLFFVDCLNNDKLQKNKDINYNKDTQQIISIPALHFNSDKHKYTLKIVDSKRVSTLKSLTPKRSDSNKKREKP